MKKIISLFLVFLLLLSGCGSIASPERPTHVVPQLRVMIHADTSFNLHERALILSAAEQIRSQTNDFLAYSIIFDLDFDSIESLKEHAGENTMVRVHSSAGNIEKNVLGYCYVNFNDLDMNNPSKIILVHDRLNSDNVWIHVAMHEMLHMARLQHEQSKRSIMYPTTPISGDVLVCLTEPDMVELCTVHGCDIKAMNPCS